MVVEVEALPAAGAVAVVEEVLVAEEAVVEVVVVAEEVELQALRTMGQVLVQVRVLALDRSRKAMGRMATGMKGRMGTMALNKKVKDFYNPKGSKFNWAMSEKRI